MPVLSTQGMLIRGHRLTGELATQPAPGLGHSPRVRLPRRRSHLPQPSTSQASSIGLLDSVSLVAASSAEMGPDGLAEVTHASPPRGLNEHPAESNPRNQPSGLFAQRAAMSSMVLDRTVQRPPPNMPGQMGSQRSCIEELE